MTSLDKYVSILTRKKGNNIVKKELRNKEEVINDMNILIDNTSGHDQEKWNTLQKELKNILKELNKKDLRKLKNKAGLKGINISTIGFIILGSVLIGVYAWLNSKLNIIGTSLYNYITEYKLIIKNIVTAINICFGFGYIFQGGISLAPLIHEIIEKRKSMEDFYLDELMEEIGHKYNISYEELLEEKENQRKTHIIETNSPTIKAPCLTNTNTHINTHTKKLKK